MTVEKGHLPTNRETLTPDCICISLYQERNEIPYRYTVTHTQGQLDIEPRQDNPIHDDKTEHISYRTVLQEVAYWVQEQRKEVTAVVSWLRPEHAEFWECLGLLQKEILNDIPEQDLLAALQQSSLSDSLAETFGPMQITQACGDPDNNIIAFLCEYPIEEVHPIQNLIEHVLQKQSASISAYEIHPADSDILVSLTCMSGHLDNPTHTDATIQIAWDTDPPTTIDALFSEQRLAVSCRMTHIGAAVETNFADIQRQEHRMWTRSFGALRSYLVAELTQYLLVCHPRQNIQEEDTHNNGIPPTLPHIKTPEDTPKPPKNTDEEEPIRLTYFETPGSFTGDMPTDYVHMWSTMYSPLLSLKYVTSAYRELFARFAEKTYPTNPSQLCTFCVHIGLPFDQFEGRTLFVGIASHPETQEFFMLNKQMNTNLETLANPDTPEELWQQELSTFTEILTQAISKINILRTGISIWRTEQTKMENPEAEHVTDIFQLMYHKIIPPQVAFTLPRDDIAMLFQQIKPFPVSLPELLAYSNQLGINPEKTQRDLFNWFFTLAEVTQLLEEHRKINEYLTTLQKNDKDEQEYMHTLHSFFLYLGCTKVLIEQILEIASKSFVASYADTPEAPQ